jgi:uncharacterized protein (DUF58 family)
MMLLVDVSGSELFGTVNSFKKEIITEISATLAFSALQNNDKVGLVLFSDVVELYIPPKKGQSHVLRIIRELLEFTPSSKKTDVGGVLKFLSNVIKKRAIVFVLSDFISSDYERTLKITGKKHDLTGIRIYDRREEKIPNVGMVQVQDAETGRLQLVNTQSRKVRQSYESFYRDRVDYFKDIFCKSGCGTLHCRADESYVKKLLGYFKRRG